MFVTLIYDAAGRLTTDRQNITGFGSADVQFTYDDDGRLTHTVIPGARDVSQTYDLRGRLWKIYDPSHANMLEHTYDSASNVTQRKNYLNNSTQEFVPDDFNRPSNRTLRSGSIAFQTETYTYDMMNRLNTVDRTDDLKQDDFDFDAIGQLILAKYGISGGGPSRTVSYSLDAAGNRSSVVDAGTTKSYVTNNLNQHTTGDSLAVNNGTSHEILGFNSLTYTYLNDGPLKAVSGNGHTYDLRSDALGRTVKRTIDTSTTCYFFQGTQAINEFER